MADREIPASIETFVVMTQKRRLVLWVAALSAASAVSLSVAGPRPEGGQNAAPRAPLMVRGFTAAEAAQSILTGIGSDIVLELRVVEGQQVKRGDIVAVLANYPSADIAVRSAEAELEKEQERRKSLAAGIIVAKKDKAGEASGEGGKPKSKGSGPAKPGIAEQEVLVKLSAEEAKLKALTMQRSGLPPDQRELEISVSQQNREHEQARLRVLKETLADDLAESDADIQVKTAALEDARLLREQAMVRSPIDGVVVHVWTHPGERIRRGIAQIVDMNRLRIVADIDEVLITRMKVGGKVSVTFRGEKTSHAGKIVFVGSEVRRTPNLGGFGSEVTNVRSVPVKIELNDPSQMPHMVGREAIITFDEDP